MDNIITKEEAMMGFIYGYLEGHITHCNNKKVCDLCNLWDTAWFYSEEKKDIIPDPTINKAII